MRKKDSSDCRKISAIYLPSNKREDEEEEGKTSNYTIMVEKEQQREKEKALLKRLID